MNLQEFIKTALIEITAGVSEARETVQSHGGSVGSMKLYGFTKDNKVLTNSDERPVVMVEFDIALAETNSTDTKGGIGVYLGAIGVGSQGSSHGGASTHS